MCVLLPFLRTLKIEHVLLPVLTSVLWFIWLILPIESVFLNVLMRRYPSLLIKIMNVLVYALLELMPPILQRNVYLLAL